MQKTTRRLLVLLALTAVLVTLFSATALGDELYARVRGTVTDPSGAVLPGVSIKAVNPATGATKQTISSSDGTFELLNLTPGTYTVSATKAGFATFTIPQLTLNVNQIYVSKISMKVGTVSEEVTVSANAAQVEQTSMQLGGTITANQLGTLPILNRNWISLQQTLPGVYSSDRFSNNYATNGSQSQQNSYLVNGTDSNDIALNTPLILPSPDSIAEVHMVTNTINPEYGRNSGAIMNAVSKSGTNKFHGTLFDSYRDTALNTADYFHPHQPTVYHQNIYGGTIGGPIVKNKTFFFFSLQNTRRRSPSTEGSGTSTVFNPATGAYGGGVASAPLSAFANLTGCTDGSCLNPDSVTPFALTGSDGAVYPAGTSWQTVFAGGTVPTSNYNATSLALVKMFVPQPNFTNDQYTFNPVAAVKSNQYIGRLDQNIGSKDALWFYAFAQNLALVDDLSFYGGTLPGFSETDQDFRKQFTVGWNHTFTPNILNELRLGYTRFYYPTVYPTKPVQPSSVGFSNITPQLGVGAGVPFMSITGYFDLGFSHYGPQPRKDQTYQITENFSWVKGRHALKFGYEGRRFQVWNPYYSANNGDYSFGGSGSYSTGDAGLDFLLGIPDSYFQGSGAVVIAQAYEHYFYAQDQFRVSNNLTLTFGTGYQIDQPLSEYQYNKVGRPCINAGQQSKVYPTAPTGYIFPGDPNCSISGGASTKYGHFGPRFGFAYSPNGGWLTGGPGKFSIRGGFGIYYNRSEEEQNLQDLGNPPFGLTSYAATDAPLFGSPSFPNPWVDVSGAGAIANKFPYTVPPPGSAVDFSFYEPMIISVSGGKNHTMPYAMNYNLTIERELPSQTILRIGYVGSQARKLTVAKPFSYATKQGVAACLASASCRTAGNFAFLDPVMSEPGNYTWDPLIFTNSGYQYNGGSSNFNSLQITVEKRMTHGLELHGTYAWAHSLDTGSSFEDTSFQAAGNVDVYGDLRKNYGDSAFDARHRFVASFTYQLPNLNKVLSFLPSRAFGGWRISGINTMQTGYPIAFQTYSGRSLTCSIYYTFYGCPDRPDLVTQPTALDPHTATFKGKSYYFFNPSDFKQNALGTEGNVRRGQLHGPSFWNTDFSLQKETKITEGTSITLGASAFNLFNHTNFSRPSGNISSSNFGRVSSVNGNSRLVQLDARFVF